MLKGGRGFTARRVNRGPCTKKKHGSFTGMAGGEKTRHANGKLERGFPDFGSERGASISLSSERERKDENFPARVQAFKKRQAGLV